MKQQISGPVGAVILAIIVVVIAVIGWRVFRTPANTGPTDAQRAAYLKSGGGANSANNQMDLNSTGPHTGTTAPAPTTPAPTTPAPATGH